jgi:peptidoglycan/xylan/chitin deacetylase (PgdA/CDA1 family)
MTAASAQRIPVLMYHEIAGQAKTSSPLAVAPDVFRGQLAYLHEAGFSTLTAGELAAFLADGTGELPERPVVLTFDDGYADFYTAALPVMKQHGFTGTLFQTTGWVGRPDAATRMLNWRELAEIERAGIEIGAHSVWHPQLDQLSEQDLRDELYASKSALEDHLGVAVPGLAYPYGYSSPRVRQVARELGYTYAYSVDNAMTTSAAGRFTFPRLTVRRSTTMSGFRDLVNGVDTVELRGARILTKGFAVVRRARSALKLGQEPAWYREAKARERQAAAEGHETTAGE